MYGYCVSICMYVYMYIWVLYSSTSNLCMNGIFPHLLHSNGSPACHKKSYSHIHMRMNVFICG